MLRWRPIKPLAVVLCTVLWLPAGNGEAAPKKRGRGPARPAVAVWNLKALGVEAGPLARARAEIESAVRRNPRFGLLSEKGVRARLQKARLDATAPVAKAVPALKAAWVLTGTLAGLGDEWSLDLKALDGKTGAEVRRAAISLPLDPAALRAELDELLVRLLEPERWVGALALETTVDGAKVQLDGQSVATTPMTRPIEGLSPGKHILMLTKEGYSDFSRFVVLRYNQTARLRVDLTNATVEGLIYEQAAKPAPAPEPAAPPPPTVSAAPRRPASWQWITAWSLTGVAVAAAGTGGIMAWWKGDIEHRIETGIWVAEDKDELDALWKKGDRLAKASTGLWIGGGVVAAAAVGLFIWDALAEPAAESSTTVIAPALVPGGAGVALGARF